MRSNATSLQRSFTLPGPRERATGSTLSRLFAWAAFTIASATVARAHAEPLRLALDVEQGVLTAARPAPYAFAVKLAPGVDMGPFRLSATLGAAFTNPRWDAAFGLAPSLVLWSPVTSNTGLRLVAEASFLTRGDWRATGGLVVDLDSFHIGPIAGYDSLSDSPVIMLTLGADLIQVGKFFGEHPF